MTLVTLPDQAGDNAAHTIASLITAAGMTLPSPPLARTLLFREISGGTTGSRVGGSNVTGTRGIPFSASDNVMLPELLAGSGLGDSAWDLTQVYVYLATGDTVAIAYVPLYD
jgi:hypothetical protein